MKINNNHPLKELNTLSIASEAEYFTELESVDDVKNAIEFAKNNNLDLKVLGGGSNVVMSDHISGLVVKYTANQCCVLSEDESSVRVKVDAGYDWHQFVLYSLLNNWNGLENLSLIPGTVGAAPVQNIGAYGVEVKDLICQVNGVYLTTGVEFSLSLKECEFEYRESVFKQRLNGQTLITSVEFHFSKNALVNTKYAPLNTMAAERGEPTPKLLSDWVVEVRSSKLPDPKVLPNAGSFFKNPVISNADYERLKERYPNLPSYPQPDGVKVPAGWLIDKLGLKGKSYGPVSVHKNQALVLINHNGTAKDIAFAANEIKREVKACYGVSLEQEPRLFN